MYLEGWYLCFPHFFAYLRGWIPVWCDWLGNILVYADWQMNASAASFEDDLYIEHMTPLHAYQTHTSIHPPWHIFYSYPFYFTKENLQFVFLDSVLRAIITKNVKIVCAKTKYEILNTCWGWIGDWKMNDLVFFEYEEKGNKLFGWVKKKCSEKL